MKHRPDWKAAILAAGLAFGAVAATDGLAGEAQTFLEVGRARFDIGGEFDDSIVLGTSEQVINVPELVESEGMHFAFGAGGTHGGFSFSYFTANPETKSVLGATDARLHLYGMEFYVLPFLTPGRAVRVAPLLRCGGALTSLTIEDSATDGVRVVDANYKGLDGCVGAGVLVRLGHFGQMIVELDRHWASYATVQGIGDRIDIDGNLSAPADYLKASFSLFL
jgi:hypothetical protein